MKTDRRFNTTGEVGGPTASRMDSLARPSDALHCARQTTLGALRVKRSGKRRVGDNYRIV